jgi:hypothetical protein
MENEHGIKDPLTAEAYMKVWEKRILG